MTEQDERRLLAGLADLAGRQEAPSARLEQNVLGAFRAEQRAKARRHAWVAYGAIAASIALLVAAGLLSRREAPLPRYEVAAVAPGPVESAAITPSVQPVARPARRVVRRPVREITEVATEFMRIPDASMLTPMESGHVVRVRVPRSAMLEFGLPINENRASELVKADVVLGEDGLARAIRFVQ